MGVIGYSELGPPSYLSWVFNSSRVPVHCTDVLNGFVVRCPRHVGREQNSLDDHLRCAAWRDNATHGKVLSAHE